MDYLRAFSLGVINVFGVAVPGFLVLFFPAVGLFAPSLALAIHASGADWQGAGALLARYNPPLLAGTVLVVLSYVAGYILRLTSPDKLDLRSAQHVLAELGEDERKVWPYQGDRGDKFPYFHLRKYLEARGLKELVPHVPWGPDSDSETAKRSKTAIHQMKLDILLASPGLTALVDSNEAHIRLLAGTWLAIGSTWPLVAAGAGLGLTASILRHAAAVPASLDWFQTPPAPPYPAFLLTSLALLVSMLWARRRIESLFHYRRVSELVFIVMAAHVARREQARVAAEPVNAAGGPSSRS